MRGLLQQLQQHHQRRSNESAEPAGAYHRGVKWGSRSENQAVEEWQECVVILEERTIATNEREAYRHIK